MSNLEISKMLTMSSCHIDSVAVDYLSADNTLIVYNKESKDDSYGWFIYLDDDELDDNLIEDNVPVSLVRVIQYALDCDCSWICLDRDGDYVDDLPQYEW